MVVKTQSGKFAQIKILFFVVGFVKKEDDGNVRFTEVVRDALVDRCKVIPAVQHEEDEVRRFYGNVRLCLYLFCKAGAESVFPFCETEGSGRLAVNSVRERSFRRNVAVFLQYYIPCVAGRRQSGDADSGGRWKGRF